jgi:hypothetical protein
MPEEINLRFDRIRRASRSLIQEIGFVQILDFIGFIGTAIALFSIETFIVCFQVSRN